MAARQLWNDLGLFIFTDHTSNGHNTVFFFGCFLGDHAFSKRMWRGIQLDVTTLVAYIPMHTFIVAVFIGGFNTMLAVFAVVASPLIAIYADAVIATEFCSCVTTAINTHSATVAYFNAILANTAFAAYFSAIGTVIAALFAEGFSAIYTPIAFFTHCLCTFNTGAAFRTELVNAAGAFSAVFTYLIGTVTADLTAFLADIGTVTALSAILAPYVLACTLAAEVACRTELIVALGAFLTALGAKIGALLASLPAGAGYGAAAAKSARRAESVSIGAVTAGSAFATNISGRAG